MRLFGHSLIPAKSSTRSTHRNATSRVWHFRPSLECLEGRSLPSVLSVLNTNDTDTGSLRQAILDANANPGHDVIQFNIPGGGVHTIQPLSPLPTITDPVHIQGYSQPGSFRNIRTVGNNANILIELDGSQAEGANGLVITAGNSTVEGLVVNNFSGVGIALGSQGGNVIEGNFIGVDSTGQLARANRVGVSLNDTANNRIGGSAPAARNVISGHSQYGVAISNPGAANNRVQGNYIGTNAAGNAAVGNELAGIVLNFGAHGNFLGTDGDGSGDATEGNVISGNTGVGGILLGGPNTQPAKDNVIAGNRIGTNAGGAAAVSNAGGIRIGNGAHHNRIGTDGDGVSDSLERNVISGNLSGGITLLDAGTDHNVIAGNYIGTDYSGNVALGNGGINTHGVLLDFDAAFNRIGTDGNGQGDAAERNVISGNYRGIRILRGASNNAVAGNYIGTDASGEDALGNATQGVWVELDSQNNVIGTNGSNDAFNQTERNVISANGMGITIQGANTVVAGNFIGTDSAGNAALGNVGNGISVLAFGTRIGTNSDGIRDLDEVNVISGNAGHGIEVGQGVTQTSILGNRIGTNRVGFSPVGNSGNGIHLVGASATTIGGAGFGERNVIAFNTGNGVAVTGSTAVGNRIRPNLIHDNGGLAIDLGNDGVTANDPGDGDPGANQLQNHPVLTQVNTGSTTSAAGYLESTPNTTFVLDFYASSTADPSGIHEANRHLGSRALTTGSNGRVNFLVNFSVTTFVGETITATATDPAGNTSELSPNQPPVADAGGAYTVVAGFSVQLDGSGSSDPNQSSNSLLYEWDLDGDGVFAERGADAARGDEVGVRPTFHAAGIGPFETRVVRLRVTDGNGLSDESTPLIQTVDLTVENGVLRVGGTLKSDTIQFLAGTTPGSVRVTFNGAKLGTFHSLSRLEARGQDDNDRITVDSAIRLPTVLDGGPGDDELEGGSGNDDLFGGDGNDSFTGGRGIDKAVGGEGDDTAAFDVEAFDGGPGQDGITIHGTDEDDRIRVWWMPGPRMAMEVNGQVSMIDYAGGETIFVHAGKGDDYVKMEESGGSRWRAEFHGGKGNDVLIGSLGDDVLDGGAGGDTLHGGAGNDLLRGGQGNDELVGGDGEDRLQGDQGRDRLTGGAGNDELKGGQGDDWLYGGGGDDHLFGGAGHDALYGDDGDDALDGGAGHDWLLGGAGDDELVGGSGSDFFLGGAGADRIRARDRAVDFIFADRLDRLFTDLRDVAILLGG